MNAYFKYIIATLLFIQTMSCAYANDLNTKYDIYYLVIGSGNYIKDKTKDRPEAVNSAHQMALSFQKIGGHGSELLSSENEPITIDNILNAIYELKQTIRKDNAKNPLVIFYYMGHGMGDNIYSSYLIPGDYDFNLNTSSNFNPEFNDKFKEYVINIEGIVRNFFFFSLGEKYENLDNEFLGEKEHQRSSATNAQMLKNSEQLRLDMEMLGLAKDATTSHFIEKEPSNSHVPYIIMLDMCSNGLDSMADLMPRIFEIATDTSFQKELKELTQGIDMTNKNGSVNKDALIGKPDKTIAILALFNKYLSKLPQNFKNKDITNKDVKKMADSKDVVNISNNAKLRIMDIRKESYSKYASILYSVNQGEESFAVTAPSDKSFAPKSKDKVGTLARRFELAVSKAKSSSKLVSFGEFIELFNDANLDSETEEPFRWFAPSPDMSNTIFIEN